MARNAAQDAFELGITARLLDDARAKWPEFHNALAIDVPSTLYRRRIVQIMVGTEAEDGVDIESALTLDISTGRLLAEMLLPLLSKRCKEVGI